MLDSAEVKQAALAVGFDDCGVARADALSDEEYPLRLWLSKGWHAGLSYMERNVDMRMDPRLLVPGAKSVICCVSAYPPPDSFPPLGRNPEIQEKNSFMDYREAGGKIAAYAKYRDYHKVVKDMLFRLRERLGIDGKVCCDTVPISDKHWAARAGLGFIGRHTLLITPRWGTWVNLGEIVTTEEIENGELKMENSADASTPNPNNSQFSIFNSQFCASCHHCVDACPNHAIAPDGPPMLNVARCTAYYTTHHERPIPPGHITAGYTQGCDLCQLACPHNIIFHTETQ
ncbi:MAG: DUF1730 domain-containing protein [Bacteroidales bacterium]|nr:DUF1730 domain-containing protein [Bacteroidales bacterium]